MTNLTTKELKNLLSYIIENNKFLHKKGLPAVTINVEGEAGLGKSSVMKQVAKEKNMDYVRLSLSELDDLGDLVGFGIRQFEMCDGDKSVCVWVDEHAVTDYEKRGYIFTGNNRTSWCAPAYVAGKTNPILLNLDDYTRAQSRFLQATMALIETQSYQGWSLPEGSTIVLTTNPDNGDYQVASLDDAQKTRFASVGLKFDIKCWAEYAENNGIDSRCINFLAMHPELVKGIVNPRAITMFFNSISSIENFEENLPLIQLIGEGCVGKEFSHMFTLFINNKLDKLISPETILFKDEDYVLSTLKGLIGSGTNYRADIASVLTLRIINYSLYYAKENTVSKSLIERLEKLITESVFTEDLRYNIIKNIFNGDKVKFRNLTLSSKLTKYILK